MIRLENWEIIPNNGNPYQAPEMRTARLRGTIYGHPRFVDGSTVTTSTIQHMTPVLRPRYAKTQNSVYILGEMKPEYEEWLRNHRQENR